MLTTSQVETTHPRSAGILPSSAITERRSAERLRQNVAITLTPIGYEYGVGCRAQDISTGGVFVTVPTDLNLEVGRRVEVTVGESESSRNTGRFEGETCFATVIRTEHLGPTNKTVVGAGLRFDHALFVDPATLQ